MNGGFSEISMKKSGFQVTENQEIITEYQDINRVSCIEFIIKCLEGDWKFGKP